MILSHCKTIFNQDCHLSGKHPAQWPVAISFAQFERQDDSRKSRRQSQSYAARQLLRQTLQYYASPETASNWPLKKTPEGKPYLSAPKAPTISLSHSANWVACAVAPKSNIGIDIEAIKPRNWRSICDFSFHHEESTWILDASKAEQNIRGLLCWCRKEALTKALGIGMTTSLKEIVFSPDGKLLALPPDLGPITGWTSRIDIVSDQAVMATVWKN